MDREIYLEKLENIYKQFISQDAVDSFNDVYFKIICKEFGYFNTIKPIEKSKLKKIRPYYRGVGLNKKYMVNLVCESDPEKIFIGDGIFSKGIYCSTDYKIALEYAYYHRKNVIKLYLDDCKIIKWRRLFQLYKIFKTNNDTKRPLSKKDTTRLEQLCSGSENLVDFLDFLKSKKADKNKDKFMECLLTNHSNFAVILGFDAIYTIFDICLVLNRGKLSVEKRFHKMLNKKFVKENKTSQNSTKINPIEKQM